MFFAINISSAVIIELHTKIQPAEHLFSMISSKPNIPKKEILEISSAYSLKHVLSHLEMYYIFKM